jgi:hypothetical protein
VVGYEIMPNNSTGNQNTAFGYQALNDNQTGSFNTAIGAKALQYNTTANGNTAVGIASYSSLNTPASFNTVIGVSLLTDNSQSNTTAIGTGALFSNSSGLDNVALGNFALINNSTGSDNNAIGENALYTNVTGTNNNAVGVGTLYTTDAPGGDNNAFGSSALAANITGTDNCAFGCNALLANTTGSDNIAIGDSSLDSCTTSLDNVGIGASSLDSVTIFTVVSERDATYDVGNNTAIGYQAGNLLTTGIQNIFIGEPATASDYSNAGVTSTSEFTIWIGTSGQSFFAPGIATNSNLDTSDSALLTSSVGQVGYSMGTSSERFKENIQTIAHLSEKFMQLRPISFHYKSDNKNKRLYGLIAEEVEEIFPELIVYDKDGTIQGIMYDLLRPLMIKEIQITYEQIHKLYLKNTVLTQRIENEEILLKNLAKYVALLESTH